MEPVNEEQVTTKVEKKKEKSHIILTSVISSTVAALITSSVFMFATDYLNTDQTQSSSIGTQQTTESTSSKANITKMSTSSNTNSNADIVENASKAIVGVVNFQKSTSHDFLFGGFGIQQNNQNGETVEAGTGSGVIWKKENGKAYIITNNHVIEGATRVEISLYNGKKTTAEVVGADALTDLAVLTIDDSYVNQTLTFGDSNSIRPGDSVLAIGNPLGLDFSRSVTQGIVSATNRSMTVNTSMRVGGKCYFKQMLLSIQVIVEH